MPLLFESANPLRWILAGCLVLALGAVGAAASLDSLVEVYDNVLTEETARWLHEECLKWDNADVVSVFPLEDREGHLSPIAIFLDGLVRELYPDAAPKTYYIEFWQRTPWQHIRAHADMDEGWERQTRESSPSSALKHPETGHVLYLDVAQGVRGPTVVWNTTKGGELLSGPAEMITVPAVEGRLLRFRGDALHAVPRPADIYWTHIDEDHIPDTPQTQRSVLLFNLWPADYLLQEVKVLQPSQKADDDGDHATDRQHSCNPKSEWKRAEVVDFVPEVPTWWELATSTVYHEFWIPLMGSARRRGTERYFVPLEGTGEVRSFFREASRIYRTTVRPPRERFLGWEL